MTTLRRALTAILITAAFIAVPLTIVHLLAYALTGAAPVNP